MRRDYPKARGTSSPPVMALTHNDPHILIDDPDIYQHGDFAPDEL
jgi:hypothetical protein